MKPRVLAYLMLLGQYEHMGLNPEERVFEVLCALDKLWWELDEMEQTAFVNDTLEGWK